MDVSKRVPLIIWLILKSKKKSTTDALEIIHQEFFRENPEMIEELERARVDDAVARKIRDLRVKAGLSQLQLAKKIGTTASAICRIENAEYKGHSLAMLNRVAEALDRRMEIHFVPMKRRTRHYKKLAPEVGLSPLERGSAKEASLGKTRCARRAVEPRFSSSLIRQCQKHWLLR